MRTRISFTAVVAIALNCAALLPAYGAGKYDGSSALICAAVVVHECATGERCQAQAAENVGLPTLMRLDFASKKIRPLDAAANRDSAIRNVNPEVGE